MVGSRDSTSYRAGITVPSFPSGYGLSPVTAVNVARYEGLETLLSPVDVGKWGLGFYSCDNCGPVSDAVSLHPDCLQLFMRNCTAPDALDRLWLALTWRNTLPATSLANYHVSYPYSPNQRQILPLHLQPISTSLSSAFVVATEKCNVPQIRNLPQEIKDVIQKFYHTVQVDIFQWYSETHGSQEPEESDERHGLHFHLLYRYTVVLDVASRLSSGPSEPLSFVPLRQVFSWERGSSPKLVDGLVVSLPIIRCTIDLIGVKKIERLAQRPRFERTCIFASLYKPADWAIR